MRLSSITFGSIIAIGVACASYGETGDGIRSRQEDMKIMSAAAKRLSDYFSGKRTYDIDDFRASARQITARSGELLSAHFSAGIAAEGSNASPSIASDGAKFDTLARDLERYSRQIADSAKKGDMLPDEMKMRSGEVLEGGPFAKKKADTDITSFSSEHAFHMMLQTCTACHAAFRLKRQ
jgi:cytochrome c556